ncbi:MAG: LysM peptidoglycan-binding domain-containing protein [gamma proteobacterium symbiont of Bathyaustriella thionipta]|nr:LysM peptidoglycan-binding domain-containing protein [gamma proteobacterium symbiont of Bathyaustriella thionipta]MCU7948747.1 LysM peptidoglycan-binding domain-containing protein [gamma proteobacterium symbiont of Bathyaustriella thionipta]MCU7953557.1 LysM peptidoglycan-binding domain-containing protein [gamma proteobacterium symbiont of Bathyaustriella thionipta]MCU7955230.1 LysM peptidoglycan-binding domain-containing protein [gamma proteobacterium symbiont of Bathyaustriella thionipta]M
MKNINKLLSLAIFALLLSTASFVLAEEVAVELKPGHPQQYTVVKGDTLWDISGTFLKKPWYWPEIWHINPQIENPHLIYPGDVLKLVYIDGKPYITRSKYGKRTVRLSPETRIEELDRAIPTIPLDVISPYLTKNRILNAREYSQLPYIVGINDEHMSAGANNSIYVMGIPEDSNDEIYGIYRRGKAYKNPANKKEVLGYEAIYLGEGTMERQGSPATIYVEKSKAEILRKHRVIPINRDKVIDASFMPRASDLKRPASIIGVLTSGMQPGVNMVGAMDVVIIDAGLKDGIEKGDVLNIYKKGLLVKDPIRANKKVKLPNEINGNLMVFRLFNRLSYAIVMDAQSTLRVGDVVQSPFLNE